jgi:photosystem II stability/assembly factor-like uncharacterized protein
VDTITPPVAGIHVRGIALDPHHPGRVYCSTTKGLFRSENRGETWTLLPLPDLGESSPQHLAVAPGRPEILYLTLSPYCTAEACSPRGLLRSNDAGTTWHTAGLPDFTLWSLAVAPYPDALYASGHNSEIGGTFDARIFHTSTGGASWDVLVPGPTILRNLTIDPRDALRVFAIMEVQFSRVLLRSIDGGRTWTPLPVRVGTTEVGASAIALDPTNANTLYLGSVEHGVFRSRNGGDTWQPVGGALDSAVISLALGHDGSVVFASTTQPSVYRLQPTTADALAAWFIMSVEATGRTARFLAQATGQPTSWLWDFGDGTTASGPTPTHVYAATGEYRVSLTVAANGVQHTVTRIMRVPAPRRRAAR